MRQAQLGRSASGRLRRRGGHSGAYTTEEDLLMGTISGDELARRLHRTGKAVEARRIQLKIPKFDAKLHQWTTDEDALLGTMTDGELAGQLGLTASAVAHRRRRVGRAVRFARRRPWTPKEDALLGTASNTEIAGRLGRHLVTVCMRRQKLGIPRAFQGSLGVRPKQLTIDRRRDFMLQPGAMSSGPSTATSGIDGISVSCCRIGWTGFAYDAAGNLNYRTNNALTQTFTVNNLNQLSNATRSGTLMVGGTTVVPATQVTVNGYVASRYADRTFAREGLSVVDGTNAFTAWAQDYYGRTDSTNLSVYLPATATFQYDLNGNLLTDGRRHFSYDDEDQLTTVILTNATKSDFVYDGRMRRRIRREYVWQNNSWQQSEEVRYIYDRDLVVEERDGNNLPLVNYTRGSDLSGIREGAGGIVLSPRKIVKFFRDGRSAARRDDEADAANLNLRHGQSWGRPCRSSALGRRYFVGAHSQQMQLAFPVGTPDGEVAVFVCTVVAALKPAAGFVRMAAAHPAPASLYGRRSLQMNILVE